MVLNSFNGFKYKYRLSIVKFLNYYHQS